MGAESKTKWSELFPTKWSPVIFVMYMALFINQGILVTASQDENRKYKYNTVMAVLLTEFIKLIVSSGIFIESVRRQLTAATSCSGSADNTQSCVNSSSSYSVWSNSWHYTTNQVKKSVMRNSKKCSCQSCHSLSHLPTYLFKQFECSGQMLSWTALVNLNISYFTYILRNSFSIFVSEVRQNKKVFFLYFIPAGLYCLYNNLAYVNLVTFDPTTYFLLLQFRVVVTGIVFQVLFKKKLSRYQWISLIFLTLGCMIKEVNFSGLFGVEDPNEPLAKPSKSIQSSWKFLENPVGILLILLQVLCSSGAGVYNEFLLKRPVTSTEKQTPILIQNVCLYIDSIICNLALLAYKGEVGAVMNFESIGLIVYTPIILAVIVNNAAIGIVTSFFLAQLNSILKTFASALELMFTAVLCWIIFGIPIHFNTLLAIMIVTWAIFLYSKEPVVNTANLNITAASTSVNNNNTRVRRRSSRDVEDMQKILDEEMEV